VEAQDWARFERLSRQAQFLLQARRYKEAIEHAMNAIALFPEDPRPYAQVAYALARQKRPEAPEWALKAIAKQPENALWRTALSDTYTLRGKWKQALKPMSEAVAMAPTNPRLQSMMGLILVHCRRPKEALQYLERSLELDPTNAFTHQRMSIALSKLFGKSKLAEEHLRKALELRPDDPSIKNTLGWRLLGRGRREQAETAFYEALRADPTQPASKLGIGAPVGIKKGPSDIILRGALRLYSIPYRIILAPMAAVLAIEIPWLILSDGGSWLVKGLFLALAAWGWCYIFSLVYVRVIGKRRGVHFV
jgi:tetratricopeptide (TPR) repeat protein